MERFSWRLLNISVVIHFSMSYATGVFILKIRSLIIYFILHSEERGLEDRLFI